MPRDLTSLARESDVQNESKLTTNGKSDSKSSMSAPGSDTIVPKEALSHETGSGLHTFTQSLTPSDVESSVCVEDAAFPPEHRATREKIEYRLKTCGEICMGIFTSEEHAAIPTVKTSKPVSSEAPDRKAILLGHIIATKTTYSTVTDKSMEISTKQDAELGHQEDGRTICIHSLAVLPQFQGRGLGKTLMRSYIQRIESQNVADRIALIAEPDLVPFYEALGFTKLGESAVKFAGGGWYDLVRSISQREALLS